MSGECPADNDAQTFQFLGTVGQLFFGHGHLQPVFLQTVHQRPVTLVGKVSDDTSGDPLADLIHGCQILERSLFQLLHRMESGNQAFCHRFTHKTNPQPIKYPFEGNLFGFFKARHQVTGALVSPTFQAQQIGYFQRIEIGRVLDIAGFVQIFDCLRPHIDVHGPPGDEMLDLPLDLGRTAGFVRTIVSRFSFRTHQRCPAFGTGTDETDLIAHQQTAGFDIDTDNLRNDLAAFLHEHLVTQMQVESFDNIRIVKGSTLYGRSGQQYRLQIGNRSDGSCPPDLERHGVKARHGTFGLELVGNRPTWAFGRESQIALLEQ